jgi:hypothetical protein
MVSAIFTGNVRPDGPVAHVLQFHGDPGKRVASRVGHLAGYVALLELGVTRRQNQQRITETRITCLNTAVPVPPRTSARDFAMRRAT